ncbi:hypothetical protein LEP1GSC090_2561, partial [Leptospira borgpetersenii serovar Javanica str. MK146]
MKVWANPAFASKGWTALFVPIPSEFPLQSLSHLLNRTHVFLNFKLVDVFGILGTQIVWKYISHR